MLFPSNSCLDFLLLMLYLAVLVACQLVESACDPDSCSLFDKLPTLNENSVLVLLQHSLLPFDCMF